MQHEIEAKIVSIATGAEFSVLLDSKGKVPKKQGLARHICFRQVWTFGHPENGTLGHNDDGKFMAKANKVCALYVSFSVQSLFFSRLSLGVSSVPSR